MNRPLALLLLALLVLTALPAGAEGTLNPGFQTLGIWQQERSLRLDVAVWYPTRRAPRVLRYGDWTLVAARRAPILPGRHPLLLLSHDTAGSRFSLHLLAARLAGSGFIVAAPTHNADNLNRMDKLFTEEQITSRVTELSALLDILLKDPPFAAAIDPARIGVIGIGPGGTAALLLAGGRLDGSGWGEYCHRAGRQDPYCSQWVAPRMELMAAAIDPRRSRRDTRIRAAAVVAPAYGMFFSARGLREVSIPLLLLRADLDAVNRAPNHTDAIRYALPQSPSYGVLAHTDNAALMSPCSRNLIATLPDICIPSPQADRREAQRQLAERTEHFMLAYLGAATP